MRLREKEQPAPVQKASVASLVAVGSEKCLGCSGSAGEQYVSAFLIRDSWEGNDASASMQECGHFW